MPIQGSRTEIRDLDRNVGKKETTIIICVSFRYKSEAMGESFSRWNLVIRGDHVRRANSMDGRMVLPGSELAVRNNNLLPNGARIGCSGKGVV